MTAEFCLCSTIIIIIITTTTTTTINAKDSLKLLTLYCSLHILMQKAVTLNTFHTLRKCLVENEKDCLVSDPYSLKPAKQL